MIFEGEYLNGEKWNGKIKDYHNNGKLEFEGEYLNGKRNGLGKEYNYDGKLQFEGIYLNGKKNGKGKEFYNNGQLKLEGEYKNDIVWNGKIFNMYGIVKMEIKDGNKYYSKYK